MKLKVVVTCYNRHQYLGVIMEIFKLQTNPNWEMVIAHDGIAPQAVKDVIAQHSDHRITFYEHPVNLGVYGFPLRRLMLEKAEGDNDDFILFTNDDNLYVYGFIDNIFSVITPEVGIVSWDIVHSHKHFNTLHSDLKVDWMDMGGLAVRLDLAKETGFNHDLYYADGLYAEECHAKCLQKGLKAVKVSKCLFTHS